MKWSISIGRVFGIQLRIHLTFFLLLAFIFFSVFSQHGLNAGIMSALFILAIFACVIIHEIGHSLIARRFGKEPKSITLLPIGGMAEVEEMPKKPAQEIAIALVGPFINVIIAGVLYVLSGPDVKVGLPHLYPESGSAFIGQLIGINIMLAAFNLLPAFPMDGGRVLRGLLAMKLDYVRATTWAAGFGQAVATFFVFFGLFANIWLALIGIFLYIGAGAESRQVVLQSLMAEVGAGEAMTTEYISLKPNDSLAIALEHFHHGCQQDFPVIGDSGVVGILTRDRILASIHTRGLNARVDEVMDKNFAVAGANMGLDQVYRILHSGNKTAVVVMDAGRLKGIISVDGIGRYFMVRAALKGIDTTGLMPEVKGI